MKPQLIKIVDLAIEVCEKAAREVVGDPNATDAQIVERIARDHKIWWEDRKRYDETEFAHKLDLLDSYFSYSKSLARYKATFISGPVDEQENVREERIWPGLEGMTRADLGYPDQLLYQIFDAMLTFTEVMPPSEKLDPANFNIENYWHWSLAMSFWGGDEAIRYLEGELQRVGNQLFYPEQGRCGNNHFYVGYQEITLESIYLARTYSEGDETAKKQVFEKALSLKSPHVKRLAGAMLANPRQMSHLHSSAEHKILHLYRKIRLSNEKRDYTAAVKVDKVPFVVGEEIVVGG